MMLPACSLALDFSLEDCGNARDDDGDGLVDCEDPECPACQERSRGCFDAVDNDGDGLVDAEDPTCWGPLTERERQVQLLRVTRCSTRRGVDLAPVPVRSPGSWALERALVADGVAGPVPGGGFTASFLEPVTGRLVGTRFEAALRIDAPGEFTLSLGAAESEPAGNFDEVSLRVEAGTDRVDARLSRGSGAPEPDSRGWTRGVPDALNVAFEITQEDIRAELTAPGRMPLGLALPLPTTSRTGRGVLGPALTWRWSGRSDTERAFVLSSLRIVREDYHPCGSPVPQPAIDGRATEILGVTSTATRLCVVGRAAAGALVSLAADPAPERTDARFGLPMWDPVQNLGASGRFATPVTWPTAEANRFVVVAKDDPDTEAPFFAVVSHDCADWEAPQVLDVVPPPDATGDLLAPAATIVRDGALKLTVLYDRNGLQARAACTLDTLSDPCLLLFEEGGLNGTRSSLAQPITTSVSVGEDIVWLSGAPGDPLAGTELGSLSLLEKNGTGYGPVFFPGSTDPGTFDRHVRQGAFWFDPDVRYVNDALNEVQQRWMIYTAAECRDCPMRIGTARLVFNVRN